MTGVLTSPTWHGLAAAQEPGWPDPRELAAAQEALQAVPPLVLSVECDALRAQMAQVARGDAFVLHAGDCAEMFALATPSRIRSQVGLIRQMATVLTRGTSVPVVTIGRLAGQYGKPRSSPTETHQDVTLPSYRGDIINGHEFDVDSRRADPWRMVRAYHHSATILNIMRALAFSGIGPATVYSSHEALVLDYETPLVRADPAGDLYATSAHFVWIGDRTRQLDGAHVEFAAQVRNPIGIKVGPSMEPGDLVRLLDKVDADRVPGRVSLITRLGAGRVADRLPALIDAVAREGRVLPWICDPMHGNTFPSSRGLKTRRFDDIVDEMRTFFGVHRALGSVPGGIHLEVTESDVTECVGGSGPLDESYLVHRYETTCDPRLNHDQSLELAHRLTQILRDDQICESA